MNEVVSMKKLYLAGVLSATAFAAGCQSDNPAGPASADEPLINMVPRGVVQSAIQQGGVGADGSLTLIVRVLANQVGVSAFQGAVTFPPGSFELVHAEVPQGSAGASFLVNTEPFATGVVRFAAFTPRTFSESSSGDGVEALRLIVRPLRPVDEDGIHATLDVVSGETGAEVPSANVQSAPGFVSAGPPTR
jgi:hypothetical protein